MFGELQSILLIDDHALFREGLALLLQRLDGNILVYHARSIEDALAYALPVNRSFLLLMDFYVVDAEGLHGMARVRQAFPSSPIVFISASHDMGLIQEALLAGANGFIHKSASVDELLGALREIIAGGSCFVYPKDDKVSVLPIKKLTPRQREVLAQLCQGKSNKEIGKSLSLSDNTVRIHLADIFRILRVNSRSEAIVLIRSGLRFEHDEYYE